MSSIINAAARLAWSVVNFGITDIPEREKYLPVSFYKENSPKNLGKPCPFESKKVVVLDGSPRSQSPATSLTEQVATLFRRSGVEFNEEDLGS